MKTVISARVDIDAGVNRILDFVTKGGGSAEVAAARALLAELTGYANVEALEAAVATSQQADSRPGNPRAFEIEDAVVFRAPVCGRHSGGDGAAEDGELFEFTLEAEESQFFATVKPRGADIDNFHGKPTLCMRIGIDHGVPCVYLTNNASDDMVMSVLATGDGLLARHHDGELMECDATGVPSAMRALIARCVDCDGARQAQVHVLQTWKKN